MKIAAVEVFGVECALPAPLRWGTMQVATKGGVLVRVRTDEGLEGLGEAGFSIAYLSRVTPVIRDVLAPLLIGAGRGGPAADRPAVAPHVRRHARLGTTRHRDLRRFRRRHRPLGPAGQGVRPAGLRAARCLAPGADRLRGAEPAGPRGGGGRLRAGGGTRLSRRQAARRAGCRNRRPHRRSGAAFARPATRAGSTCRAGRGPDRRRQHVGR